MRFWEYWDLEYEYGFEDGILGRDFHWSYQSSTQNPYQSFERLNIYREGYVDGLMAAKGESSIPLYRDEK